MRGVSVGDGSGLGLEAVGLVVPLERDGTELGLVPAAVVTAEEQVTLFEDDADVRLGAAAVAAVGCLQRAGSESRSSHVACLPDRWSTVGAGVVCIRTNM